MAAMLETPSRIWRRIEAVQDREMPSLPSLPSFDGSDEELEGPTPSRVIPDGLEDDFDDSLGDISSPMHSTPATSNHTHTTTIHAPPSAASTARFAHSIASRSSKSSVGPTTLKTHDSFDITDIPSLSAIPRENSTFNRSREDSHRNTKPGAHLPAEDDEEAGDPEYSLSEALQSVSRASTPPIPFAKGNTPKKAYDYSISLKSEPKVCFRS